MTYKPHHRHGHGDERGNDKEIKRKATNIPENDEDLAHTLVVELLSHQFAYPVQWIETQDVLFKEQKIERSIEIGPSNTLTGMAKQTLGLKYRDHDIALSIKRQTISAKHDSGLIYFELDGEVAKKPKTSASNDNQTVAKSQEVVQLIPPPPPAAPVPTSTDQVVPQGGAGVSAPVSDIPISAEDILFTVLAEKLKIPIASISNGSTIKQLVGGRSTLENEIVGDLLVEFGNVPEKPEEYSIKDLGKALETPDDRRLGKQTSMLLQKVISTKMPGGFTVTSARKYLERRWGFGTGRQDSVLLSTITSLPAGRLQSEKEAEAYIDNLVAEHAKSTGLSLSSPERQQSVMAVENPEAMKNFELKQNGLAQLNLNAYASYLGVDLQSADKAAKSYETAIADLQSQVDVWNAEHGEAYAAGILPMFDSKKVRVYSSYWNWALQDLLTLVNEIDLGKVNLDYDELETMACRIINRATPRLNEVIRYFARQSPSESTRIYLRALLHRSTRSLTMPPLLKASQENLAPRTTVDMEGNIKYSDIPRDTDSDSLEIIDKVGDFVMDEPAPIRHIRRKTTTGWKHSVDYTAVYLAGLDHIEKTGISFEGKTVLLTGAGQRSIGSEIVNGLLSGGAKVIVTTSNLSTKTAQIYQKAYSTHGGKNSRLILLPFNQGSQQDVESLVSYIYNQKDGLGWDLDFVIPFAAIGTAGRAIDAIDSKSELAHRIMLVNVIRLLGAIKKHKESGGHTARPTHAILPLSPNNGNFGNDGLYAESKIALEGLSNKWYSEGWSDYLSLCGASIGWTRGTGLMNQNDIVAEGLEELGGRTFSRQEMAISILGLMHQPLVELSQVEPLFADITGGLGEFPNLQGTLSQIRRDINGLSEIRRAVRAESLEDMRLIQGGNSIPKTNGDRLKRRANLQLGFPTLPKYESELRALHGQLKDMVDLERVVAIVGFSEIGPWGNSRTRWEMEAFGTFTLEGCTEMAWIMGLIKYSEKPGPDGKQRRGWVDAKTGAPVEESEVKERYEEYIVQHAGIRLVEPTFSDNYDPHNKLMMQEIIVQQDLAPFECPKETAEDFKRLHGDKAEIIRLPDGENYNVFLKQGASIMVPKAIDFKNDVGAQIPTGWSPKTYGIPDDIISQVDPNTLYVLTCTVEALLSAGITDPYEIYKYIHYSQLGNCIGTGIGGAASFAKMMRDRFQEKSVQKDILQETFANTTGAWVNMLLLSSSGPIRTPVGACATAVESLDTAYDLIIGGKAKMCLVGGVDDFTEDLSFEFANMKATSNAEDERAKGRSPEEMSRPTASSRKGFMESHGAGMQIVCTAKLAVEMGLPIYGVVAYTNTSSDKASRSVPAPGKGVLINAKESASSRFHTPLLDIKYRKRQINLRRQQIVEWKSSEMRVLNMAIHGMRIQDPSFDATEYHQYMSSQIEFQAKEQEKDVFNSFGNQFWRNNPEISPIKGALATWGLTIDDLDLASFHGTSTVMNDKNESSIIQDQLTHLGRTKGNTIMSVFQKHLTGHPKGAAGAWMINGCLQSLRTGLIPGNKNADNLDDGFQQYDLIAYTDRTIQTSGVRAFSVTSFGFGQKGAQVIGVHPKYLLATLEKPEYNAYMARVHKRQRDATAIFNEGLLGNCLFVAKDRPPYDVENEIATLLNPNARL